MGMNDLFHLLNIFLKFVTIVDAFGLNFSSRTERFRKKPHGLVPLLSTLSFASAPLSAFQSTFNFTWSWLTSMFSFRNAIESAVLYLYIYSKSIKQIKCLICKYLGLLKSLGSNSLRAVSMCDHKTKPWHGTSSYLSITPFGGAGIMQAMADPIM